MHEGRNDSVYPVLCMFWKTRMTSPDLCFTFEELYFETRTIHLTIQRQVEKKSPGPQSKRYKYLYCNSILSVRPQLFLPRKKVLYSFSHGIWKIIVESIDCERNRRRHNLPTGYLILDELRSAAMDCIGSHFWLCLSLSLFLILWKSKAHSGAMVFVAIRDQRETCCE